VLIGLVSRIPGKIFSMAGRAVELGRIQMALSLSLTERVKQLGRNLSSAGLSLSPAPTRSQLLAGAGRLITYKGWGDRGLLP